MAIALSSLRVAADFDASAYTRGATQKTDADARMIAADKARNASLAQADAALLKSIPGVAALSKSLLDGYGAGATFEAQVRKIGSALDRGLGLDRANALLDATYRKFGLTADAAALAEAGFVSIAGAVDEANRRYDAHSTALSRVIAQTEALTAAERSQAAINSQFGIGANDNSASRGQDIAALGVSLDSLRAKYSPLFAAQQSYLATLKDLNSLEARTALTETERADAISRTKSAFAGQVTALHSVGTETGLAAFQMTNLGYQVNDIVTGLATGQSPFMILAQQGGQVQQILSSGQGGVTGSLKSIGTSLLGLVTPGRVAFTVAAGSIGLATAALISYEGKLTDVQRQLAGMGRASGATVGNIESIAVQNSSPSGLSVNEARNLATALAATGKVGVDAIGPIVALGHDFAATYGVDAKEATEILAKAFADPVQGAQDLNQRLGFLDAGTKDLISSLVIQGQRQQAVAILTDALKSSLLSASEVTSAWGHVWTVTGNAVSGFFDQVGRGADLLVGGRGSLQGQINGLTTELLELQKAKIEGGFWNWLTTDINPDERIAAINAQLDTLSKRRTAQQPTADTGLKARGAEIDAIAKSTLPTVDATRKLRDETLALGEAFARPELQKYVNLVGTDLVLAFQRKKAAADASVGADPIRNQIADADAQIKALDQRSIAARSQFARDAEIRRQSLDPNAGSDTERLTKQNQAALLAAGGQTALDNVEKQRIATLGSMASITDIVKSKQLELDNAARDGVNVTLTQRDALLQLAREQALGIIAMKQQGDATRIQAETLGMSAGAAAEYTAVQTRLAQTLRDKQVLTATDIEQIKQQAAALGKVTQAAALAQVRQDIKFGAATSLLSPDDVAIAQQLKGVYPDVATALNSVEASGLRANAAISGVSSSISNDLSSGLTDITTGAKSVSAGFGDMATAIIRDIESMIIKLTVVGPLMRALQAGLGGGLNLGGLGFNPIAGVTGSAHGNAFADGNVIPFARGGAFTNQIFNTPTFFKFASGGSMSNGVMGEAGPEAVMPLRRGADGKLGIASAGSGSNGATTLSVNFHNAPSGTEAGSAKLSKDKAGNMSLDIVFKNAVTNIVAGDLASNGPIAKASMARSQGFGGQ